MKPVRLPASATHALPRWALFALCLLYILPGLIGRDPWKPDDAAGFGIMWTMANGSWLDWLSPHIVGLPMPDEGPLAFWLGAICIKLFGWLLGDPLAARVAPICFFLLGSLSVWYTTYLLGRRPEAQPLKLAFGGQPEPRDFGRTLADGALLIYLGCLGLLVHSHGTTSEALQVSLVAFSLYTATRLFESHSTRSAIAFGLVLGLLILSRGWVVPLAIWVGVVALASARERAILLRLMLVVLPLAAAVAGAWVFVNQQVQPFGTTPTDAWMAWNYRQIGAPTLPTLQYFFKNAIWFAWPAWPFAIWAVYAWRRQHEALHITLPLTFFGVLVLIAFLNPHGEEAILLPLLPMLAILAAFGLPTMKRGAINAVDWFSVMMLSTCATFIWLGWIAKQTGWPAQIAKNAFKIAPGFKPEFSLITFLIAAAASAGWIWIVYWRISRRPSVLWRAVVLSSGGIILCWLLLMTLWLPWGNYIKSYASVARQLDTVLPTVKRCVATNVGPSQRASFAYFGEIQFAQFDDKNCDYLLLQDNHRGNDSAPNLTRNNQQWKLIWQGRRPADREERFRLYRRVYSTAAEQE
ncbi:MAG: glycosyltransferase family 39 protein [Herminiimonas sp.]|uniref:ArnT family glycosyltransferase n=1 Tax=Herminiimonas sp. TaxID=1926289 RepID=UPI002723728B|nr:glycosyltransferase family 39 protein [Herminiimonas sp.]MDO9420407.1 glycosyltransferase family 39 protein [Herminiimonas sp.]